MGKWTVYQSEGEECSVVVESEKTLQTVLQAPLGKDTNSSTKKMEIIVADQKKKVKILSRI